MGSPQLCGEPGSLPKQENKSCKVPEAGRSLAHLRKAKVAGRSVGGKLRKIGRGQIEGVCKP